MGYGWATNAYHKAVNDCNEGDKNKQKCLCTYGALASNYFAKCSWRWSGKIKQQWTNIMSCPPITTTSTTTTSTTTTTTTPLDSTTSTTTTSTTTTTTTPLDSKRVEKSVNDQIRRHVAARGK